MSCWMWWWCGGGTMVLGDTWHLRTSWQPLLCSLAWKIALLNWHLFSYFDFITNIKATNMKEIQQGNQLSLNMLVIIGPRKTYLSSLIWKICYDELREDVMIWVLETRIFESDQNEFQSVVPTLYVVKICGNCILNAKNSKKQFKRSISLFSLCAEESSLLKWPIFDGNLRNENAFFSMFSTSMT